MENTDLFQHSHIIPRVEITIRNHGMAVLSFIKIPTDDLPNAHLHISQCKIYFCLLKKIKEYSSEWCLKILSSTLILPLNHKLIALLLLAPSKMVCPQMYFSLFVYQLIVRLHQSLLAWLPLVLRGAHWQLENIFRSNL